MKYYKIINGEFEGFYSKEIHGDLSEKEGFFEISEEKWLGLLEAKGEIKYIDGELVNYFNTREDDVLAGNVTLESEKNKARIQREKEYAAYHKLINNLFMGIEGPLTPAEESDIRIWHQAWRDVPNNYTDLNTPIERSYPERLNKLNYYYSD